MNAPSVPDAPAYVVVDGWLRADGTETNPAGVMTPVNLCLACGAIVWDPDRHQTLHAALKALLIHTFPGSDE